MKPLIPIILLILSGCVTFQPKEDFHIIVTVPETTYHIVSRIEQIPCNKKGCVKDGEVWTVGQEWDEGVLPYIGVLGHEQAHLLDIYSEFIIDPDGE